MKPTVSVLMPVYNAERFVAKTIESILSQTFQDFEFLILNDGSTDNSLRILEKYARKDKRIHLFNRGNQGITKSTNELLRKAEGEFIAIIDSDDLAMPNRFTLQVKLLWENSNIVGVGGAYIIMDEKGRLLLNNTVPITNEEIQHRLLAGYAGDFLHPTSMSRRTALLDIQGYREDVIAALDLDLFLRLGEIGELANVEEFVLKYRVRSSSYSAQKTEMYSQEAKLVCEQAWKRRGIEGCYAAGNDGRIRHDPNDRHSTHAFMLKYGWWGFNSGYRWTAFVYALKAIAALPSKLDGWKLLIFVLFRRMPAPKTA